MENSRTGPLGFVGVVDEANVFHQSTLSDVKFPFREPLGAVGEICQLCSRTWSGRGAYLLG